MAGAFGAVRDGIELLGVALEGEAEDALEVDAFEAAWARNRPETEQRAN